MPNSLKLRFLLLQVRNQDDPMRPQEVGCFARVLRCEPAQIEVFDLLAQAPSRRLLGKVDMVLLGGSGHYSAAGEGAWLDRALDSMRLVCDLSKPTFASCWGFQAMSRAMGGRVIHDAERAEIGTHQIRLTPTGLADPVFGSLGEVFAAQMGHTDLVAELPPGASLLASTDLVPHQAFRFDQRPIYCTQFHPELNANSLLERVRAYPEYIQAVTGMTLEKFAAACHDTPETEALIRRFVRHVFAS